jgi:PTS system fructose-specific IIC component
MKFIAVSSCPTGIAHTYMAAEALEQAGKAAGHEVFVETQGAAGSTPLDPQIIADADGVIFAADLEVKDKGRFAGKPTIDVGVKKAVHDPAGVIAMAVAAVEAAPKRVPGAAAAPVPVQAARKIGVGTRIRQYLMTGVSHMIPFVAAGGILIGLGFMLGGYKVYEFAETSLFNGYFNVT